MKKVEKFYRYLKDYKFQSIFFRNLRLLLALVLIPLTGIVAITYYGYSRIQENEQKAYCREESLKLIFDMDKIFKEAKTQLSYICHNQDVELFLYRGMGSPSAYGGLYRIYDLIQMAAISNDYINDMCVYSVHQGLVLSTQGISTLNNYGNNGCLSGLLAGGNQTLRLTENKTSSFRDKQISLYYNLNLGASAKGIGVVNLDPGMLVKSLNGKEQPLYMSFEGKLLYSPEAEEIGSLTPAWIPFQEGEPKGGEIFYRDKTPYITASSKEYGYSLTVGLDFSKNADQLQSVRNFMVLFIVLMTGVTIVLSFYISDRIFRPIKSLLSLVEQNETLLLGEQGDHLFTAENELKYLEAAINRTIFNTRDIRGELDERIKLLKKAQALALQSQINPHFLNNTLETIRWFSIAKLGEGNDVAVITEALSGMLRMALEDTDTIVPISRELAHVKMYLLILQRRYEGKFNVLWEIPEEILQCRTIKIVLQPLVENAFYHGIKQLSEMGTIIIRGKLQGGVITLSVVDNGLGMSPTKLTQLNERLKVDVIQENVHIGLSNVNGRVRLYFGESYGVTMESEEFLGSTASVRFPDIRQTDGRGAV